MSWDKNTIKIRNYDDLLKNGDAGARKRVLGLMDAVLEEMDAGRIIRSLMRLDGDLLTIGEKSWDLKTKKNIYLFGAGKACNAMAQAVCEILGERVTKGVVSVKITEPQDRYVNTDVYVGGHPLPNAEGLAAAEKMLSIIDSASEDDLFILLISGGSSALITYPVSGITLEDEIAAQDILLKSGAKILEINAVRRHISRTNGGRLAEGILQKKAECVSLIISDSVNLPYPENRKKPAQFFGTPAAPDKTTINDARDTIKNYALQDKLPKRVIDYFAENGGVRETPKSFNDKLTIFILGAVTDTCAAAARIAEKAQIPLMVLSTFLEGESREAGYILSSVIREIRYFKRPVAPPCFVVCSGETTTYIGAPPAGTGGPSHELALAFSINIRGMDGVAGASIDTEGTDGTTFCAGGLADGKTYDRLNERGIDVYDALRRHSTGDAFKQIGDQIYTGNTGTNLCDFNVFYIS